MGVHRHESRFRHPGYDWARLGRTVVLLLALVAPATTQDRTPEEEAAFQARVQEAIQTRKVGYAAALELAASLKGVDPEDPRVLDATAAIHEAYKLAHWSYGSEAVRPAFEDDVPELFLRLRAAQLQLTGELAQLPRLDSDLQRFYVDAGHYQDAQELIETVYLDSIPEDHPYLPRHYTDLALVARLRESWSESEDYLRRAQELLDAHGEGHGELAAGSQQLILGRRFALATQRGDWAQAKEALQAFQGLARERNRPEVIMDGYDYEMRYYSALQQYQLAVLAWERAKSDDSIAELRDPENPDSWRFAIVNSFGAIASAHQAWASGDQAGLEQACSSIESSLAFPGVRKQDATWLRVRRAYVLSHLGRHTEVMDALRSLRADLPETIEQDEVRSSLATLEARSLLDLGSTGEELEAARRAVEAEWDHMLEDLASQRLRSRGVASLSPPERREMLSVLLRLRLKLDGEAKGARSSLEELLRAQTTGTLYRALGGGDLSLEEALESLLGEDNGIYVVLPSETRIEVWCVDQKQVTRHTIQVSEPERRATLGQLLGRIAAQRRDPSQGPEALEKARQAASQLLLPKDILERTQDWQAMTVVGLEVLGYVPFGYLLGDDGEALGYSKAMTLLPSLPIGHRLHQRAQSPPTWSEMRSAFYACPDPKANLDAIQELRFGEEEAARLTAHLEPGRLRLIQGPQATRQRLLAEDWSGERMLTVVAHGLPRADGEPGSSLVLYGGERVTGESLEQGTFPEITVVHACGANDGQLMRGDDGRNRLLGSLILGGSNCIALPYLSLDYETALAISAGLAKGAREGQGMAESLRLVRRDRARGQSPSQELEFFLTHVMGKGDSRLTSDQWPLPKGTSPALWWSAGLACVLLLGIGWASRRPKRG